MQTLRLRENPYHADRLTSQNRHGNLLVVYVVAVRVYDAVAHVFVVVDLTVPPTDRPPERSEVVAVEVAALSWYGEAVLQRVADLDGDPVAMFISQEQASFAHV